MPDSMLSKIRDTQPQTGQGGPSQDELRRMLMRQDPMKYRNLVRRGFVAGPSTEYMPQGATAMADQLMNADNPAVQFAPNVVSATPSRALASPEELVRNDLIWRSLQSERIMRDELAQAVASGDIATAEKLRKELRGMGYAVE